jgi:hypothetical protein
MVAYDQISGALWRKLARRCSAVVGGKIASDLNALVTVALYGRGRSLTSFRYNFHYPRIASLRY